MSLQIDLFWSFRSPYSYLLMPRIMQLTNEFDVEVHARPVYPLAVRDPSVIKRKHPQFLDYFLLDSHRLADYFDMPMVQPDPDPVDFAAAMRAENTAQPRIERLMRLAAAAAMVGRGLPFVDQVSQMIFGGVRGWDEDALMHAAIERAGLDVAELERAVIAEVGNLDQWIERNHRDQAAAGHWGVPLMVFDGEAFFGQDRFELLLWRLKQNGLSSRNR
jgi:2-hydroxychromene-2-carboxylate isomerase